MLKNRIALLALASACSGLAAFGCSAEGPHSSEETPAADLQKVEFNLSVDGASVSTVAYVVTDSSGATIKSGDFDVPLSDSSFMVQLLLPVRTDYTLSISGNGTKEGRTTPCVGSAEFDVVAGTNPPIEVTVVCTDTIEGDNSAPATGSVTANVSFVLDTVLVPGEECGFTHGVVGPLKQLVGSNIQLQSQYVPATATTVWSSSNAVGTFAEASADDTTFTCTSAGTTVISSSLTSGTCTDTFAVAVECVDLAPPTCGNGAIDAGETCATCPADVLAVNGPTACDPVCGDGVIDAGETCATCPADVLAVNGPTACDVPPVCGNGAVEPGEECDDGNTVAGDGCSATCTVEPVIFCGDGIVNGTEQCDDGNNVNGDGCDENCQTEVVELCGNGVVDDGETCDTCPQDQPAGACDVAGPTCSDCYAVDPVLTGYGLDAYQASLCDVDPLCLNLQACVKDTGCYAGDNPSNLCYCGYQADGVTPVDTIACISPAFEANGPCADVMRAGLGDGLNNQVVLERQFDANFPAGAGFFLIATSRDLNVCQSECGW